MDWYPGVQLLRINFAQKQSKSIKTELSELNQKFTDEEESNCVEVGKKLVEKVTRQQSISTYKKFRRNTCICSSNLYSWLA